ncbi:PorT family protein [Larkinella sp. C7]|uniref:PorT family protein n=1 Tax=Larkinella sp. C7 TaxID=2576607 RepID=UPI001E376991|nr:PorT family protein [Larkinella sp. C7]
MMKRNSILLAVCLLGTWSANAQNNISSDTTRNSATTVAPTNSATYSSTPATTNSYSSTSTTADYGSRQSRVKADKPYKAFTGGIYVGANSTRYRGEDVDGDNPSGRLGYQIGGFVRGGGRIYGQLGAEYFASSSNYFTPGDGASVQDISGRINTKWLQIPAYIGVKLAQSDRGISAVRFAVGAEYANRLSSNNTVNVDENEIKSGTFLGLVNLGFDMGPVLIDLVYHHGFSDAISGFNNSQRRALGVNLGFKF